MVNYKNGKIYKIVNDVDDEVYVGSTCQKLSMRMGHHRRACKKCNSKIYKHMNLIGIEHFKIYLIEECPCDNKEQLIRREGEIMKQIGTLNCNMAGRTTKEWYRDNKETKKAKSREWYRNTNYYEKNKEKITEYQKEHYEDNKEKIAELKKQYRQKNKIQIAEMEKIKAICPLCGFNGQKKKLKRHQRSNKCIEAYNNSDPYDTDFVEFKQKQN